MPIVGGLDIRRRQVTFDYLDTATGQVRRGQVCPAYREHLRAESGPACSDRRRLVPGRPAGTDPARQRDAGWRSAGVAGTLAPRATRSGPSRPARNAKCLPGTVTRRPRLPPARRLGPRPRYDQAIIGRNAAIVQAGRFRLTGRLAWITWGFLHLTYLPGAVNRMTTGLKYLWWHLAHEEANRVLIEPQPAAALAPPTRPAASPAHTTPADTR